LKFDYFNIENKQFYSDGIILSDLNFYEHEKLFLKNIEYYNERLSIPFRLALVLKVFIWFSFIYQIIFFT